MKEIVPFLDLPLKIDAELGRRGITLRELLRLETGAVLTLDRSAGENVDVLTGGITIGSAEVVVMGSAVVLRMTSFRDVKEQSLPRTHQA